MGKSSWSTKQNGNSGKNRFTWTSPEDYLGAQAWGDDHYDEVPPAYRPLEPPESKIVFATGPGLPPISIPVPDTKSASNPIDWDPL